MTEIEQLLQDLEKYNDAYRKGKPLVSDDEYDDLVEKLRSLAPDHPYLQYVEPEQFDGKREIRHPVAMLSTEKAYTKEQLERFVARVKKEAAEIGIYTVTFRITPKLDGLAGRDDGTVLASRGNGEVGYDITNAFTKGIVPFGGRGKGVGEIVIRTSYFEEHLSAYFEHPRNMVVGIVTSDVVNEFAKKALEDQVVQFVPYSELQNRIVTADELVDRIEEITKELASDTDFPMDGMVAEVVEEDVREYMAATAHHYRWQIAIKSKGETAVTVVEDITWQVGRTGSITPVMNVKPVTLSGATIRNVTAHHAGLIRDRHIGAGAEIEIIRSGEVIPKLEKVITPSDTYQLPETCPSCGEELDWDNDFLKCSNFFCRAKTEQKISHWFKTLGTADWFGIKTIRKLVDAKFDSLEKIYAMTENDFVELGFGPVQSKNLAEAIVISKTKQVEDWRFLAAFGISDLSKGDSRKLLSYFHLEELLDVKEDRLEAIHGFGELTSRSIVNGIAAIKDTMRHMLALGFNLEKTSLAGERETPDSPISGKYIVFTGKMLQGSREEMQTSARKLGAKVQTAVSANTDFLVCGEKVGATKIAKAEKSGAAIISEKEYLELLKSGNKKDQVQIQLFPDR
ncbi:MAG: DNA ligase [Desulfobacterales bacterium]|nr:DNA ligase [Desulfobacterales bacterium]